MNFYFTESSVNRKLGPIPVVTVSKTTCPTSCPLMNNGCYADGGPLRILWQRLTENKTGTPLKELCKRIVRLPKGQLWRYGQAGDLPGEGDHIDADATDQLVKANAGRPVIAYTHKPMTRDNLAVVMKARSEGFSINLSADNMEEADELADTGVPTVVVLHEDYGRRSKGGEWTETLSEYRDRVRSLVRRTPKGRKIAVCPQTYIDVRCIDCRACVAFSRNAVIGFPAHGARKRHVNETLTLRKVNASNHYGSTVREQGGDGEPH